MKVRTLKTIINLIQKHYKVTTAAQVGLDTEVSEVLKDYFWSTTYIEDKSEWTFKVFKDLKTDDTNLRTYTNLETELLEELEYLEFEVDFLYIHSRHSSNFKREVFNFFSNNKTKFIITHPSVITGSTNRYKKITFHAVEGDYKLFYLDLLQEELEELQRKNQNG